MRAWVCLETNFDKDFSQNFLHKTKVKKSKRSLVHKSKLSKKCVYVLKSSLYLKVSITERVRRRDRTSSCAGSPPPQTAVNSWSQSLKLSWVFDTGAGNQPLGHPSLLFTLLRHISRAWMGNSVARCQSGIPVLQEVCCHSCYHCLCFQNSINSLWFKILRERQRQRDRLIYPLLGKYI